MLKSRIVCATCVALILAMPVTAFAQGSLEPPGPPGPVMKTLQQVEPRTPVTGSIVSSGSYYLTENYSGQLNIDADNVTLDLNGFTIIAGDNSGLRVDQTESVTVHNGYIINSGSESVASTGVAIVNGRGITLRDLRITDTAGDCISVTSPSGLVTIERVQCERNQYGGIVIRQDADLPLSVVLRDNVIDDPNLSTNLSTAGILVTQNTANPSRMIITGNTVINARSVAYNISDVDGATALGEMVNNLASDCGATGYFVKADLLIAKNRSVGCQVGYNLIGATRAAPVTAITSSPGAWDNIVE